VIRKARPTDGAEMVQLHYQPGNGFEIVGKPMKRLKLAALRPLAITGVESRDLIVLAGQRCGDAAIHSTTHQNYGFGFIGILVHSNLPDFNRLAREVKGSDTSRMRAPYVLVDLKLQPDRKPIVQNPPGQVHSRQILMGRGK